MEPQNQQQPQVFTPGEQPASAAEPVAPLQYMSGQLEQLQQPVPAQNAPVALEEGIVRWSASEFIAHEKNGSWFAMLAAGAIILSIFIFIITRAWLSSLAILLLAGAVGVFGNLKPRVLEYVVSPEGITIGNKHFTYDTFQSFAVIEDSALASLQLLPLKRFMVPITVYLDPAQADNIVDTLGEYLPFEVRERDMTEKISTRFRF
jgi:hypothetical protein